jgi:hypothetical protein
MVRTVERDRQVRRTDTREDVVTDPQDRGPRKIEDFVWFLVAAVAILIFIRFILLLFGARTGVPFVDFWYGLTAPLITPFAGMFGTIDTFNTYTGQRVEVESLVAILVYALIGYLIVLGIRLFRKEPRSE